MWRHTRPWSRYSASAPIRTVGIRIVRIAACMPRLPLLTFTFHPFSPFNPLACTLLLPKHLACAYARSSLFTFAGFFAAISLSQNELARWRSSYANAFFFLIAALSLKLCFLGLLACALRHRLRRYLGCSSTLRATLALASICCARTFSVTLLRRR